MVNSPILLCLFIIVLTLASGWCDAQGFINASKMWSEGKLIKCFFIKSAIGFSLGIITYWFIVRFLMQLGVNSAALQTLTWFAVTIVGVAVIDGQFIQWGLTNKILATLAFCSIAALLHRTS